jgi:hypothetical protein
MSHTGTSRGQSGAIVTFTIGLAITFAIAACDSSDGSGAQPAASTPIPQPNLSSLNQVTRRRLAPEGRRVDLMTPSFSNPTEVTNPLFPISDLESVVILGEVEGEPLKVETTLLPETKTVEWNGQQIEALQSQFLAYLKGRITESAIDLYAQADDGSVWYFGEDVVDYLGGHADTSEGTWRVGVDGPAAMIMPAHPKVGDVYRTENIPGVAFEQVTVRTTGKTVDGPVGPIDGAMVGVELHQDERPLEPKTFAPGHGEFFSGSPHDFEANALTVPADATSEPVPAELGTISSGAAEIFDAARANDWKGAADALGEIGSAWDAYRSGEVPRRLGARMNAAVDALTRTVATHSARAAAQDGLDVADASLDLQLGYRPPIEVDLARLELWASQLLLDAEAKRSGPVTGDVTTVEFIRDRLALDAAAGNEIDDQLRYLRAVADAEEFGVAADEAARLREAVTGLEPTS